MRPFLLIIISFHVIAVSAQKLLPTPRNVQATYNKGTRSTAGKPGKNYWQNTAAYDLNIQFDPATRLLTGIAEINYTNTSPDTLKEIWFKLYPNLYKKGSTRQFIIATEDAGDGVIFDQLAIDGKPENVSKLNVRATNMTVKIPPLVKGKSIRFTISYHYILNKGSHNRTGEVEPNADFVAYFFPRIAVYDDIDGWDRNAMNGLQEFYNDFCHFNAFITVPKNFVVWATGDLKNCSEVFTPAYCRRINEAEQNDAVTTIIDSTDLKAGNITTDKPQNTWHFEADNVTDFVFACSDHYIWKSSSLVVDPKTKRRTRVDAVFNLKHKDYFPVINDARKTIEAMSYVFPAWPFPYAHETVFDGLDQMEYPMMVNDNPVEDRAESIELTDHEIFHTMFPFYMGINETKYVWMDEGWAAIAEWLISPMIDSTLVDEYGVDRYNRSAGTEDDLPLMTPSTQLTAGYFINSYPKPAMAYLYIKDLLGDSLFTKALHHYIEQWHGRHPMPNDFFYSMNEGSGHNLNWFWKKWFFDNGFADLGISSVKKKDKTYAVLIGNKGTKPVPVDLNVFYADGTTEKIHRSIAIWEKGNVTVSISFVSSKKVNKIVLGSTYVADVNKADNIYQMK
jgi:hypothetical protein